LKTITVLVCAIATSTETSEGPGANGDSFVSDIDVLAGESYFIVIDRPVGNSPFSLEWTGTATFPDNPSNPLLASPTTTNLFTGATDLYNMDIQT